ncbi:MAG TPA: hypothetical protein VEY12_04935 [Thermoplasmata archaeon]|nr:hypothetical protein [Thermoplasmata archaeon]
MAAPDPQMYQPGFVGTLEKASVLYFTQIMTQLGRIKENYYRLHRDFKELFPEQRHAISRAMRADWDLLRVSAKNFSNLSGYPFERRLREATERLDGEYRLRIQRTNAKYADDPSTLQCKVKNLHQWKEDRLILAYMEEAERALIKAGTLFSTLYAGMDLLEDFKRDIIAGSRPTDLGPIPNEKVKHARGRLQ